MMWPLAALLALALLSSTAHACSCMLSHAQQQYCRADYVMVARVRSSVTNVTTMTLNVTVAKVFKMNDEATRALASNTLFTPNNQGLCGVSLRRDVKYLLAGRAVGDRAWIYTCDTHREWNSLTDKQRKGFRLLYRRGCECKVNPCPWWARDSCSRGASDSCPWTTAYEPTRFDCQGALSICMRQRDGRCDWNRSRAYRACVKASKARREP